MSKELKSVNIIYADQGITEIPEDKINRLEIKIKKEMIVKHGDMVDSIASSDDWKLLCIKLNRIGDPKTEYKYRRDLEQIATQKDIIAVQLNYENNQSSPRYDLDVDLEFGDFGNNTFEDLYQNKHGDIFIVISRDKKLSDCFTKKEME